MIKATKFKTELISKMDISFIFQGHHFYTIRSFGMGNDCMLSFTFYIDLLLEKYENF